jgi:hypothetical protein
MYNGANREEVNMGELNEEKLKQMLDEYSMNVQASINNVYKEVKQIKDTLERQDRSSSWLWLSAIGIAIMGLGSGMLSFATNTPDKIENGIVVVVGLFIFTVGLYYRPSKSKDTSNRDS